jgi:predicted dehydrogenase
LVQKTVSIGLIGGGMIGQRAHISQFTEIERCRVLALAELRPKLGRLVCRKFGIPKLYSSHREMLEDPEIEAVIVVTRRHATGPIVLDALRSGRHVLSEKPMAHTRAQAERLVSAQPVGKCYSIGYMKRHDAGVAQAKILLDALRRSGELGQVVLVRAWCFGGDIGIGTHGFVMTDEVRPDGIELWPIAPDWVPNSLHEAYAGFLNVNIHVLNLLRYMLNSTPTVSSSDLMRSQGRIVTFDFGEIPCVFEMAEGASADWREGIEILFEKGRLHLAMPPPLLEMACASVELDRAEPGSQTIRYISPRSTAFRRQAEAFVDDILQQREPIASGADSIEDLALAESIWRKALEDV